MYWPCLAGQTVFPVQTAVRYKVPLIIWGAHQGLEQVGMFLHEHEVEMTRRYRKDHDLMGYEADELLSVVDTLQEGDIWQYRYPEDSALHAVGVRGIYLGNYVRWDPKAQHEQMIRDFGYRSSSFSRTFDCYDYVDCFNYMDIHDTLKLYKHGYSKVTDHACREIRFGRITRGQGLAYVRNRERVQMKFHDLFAQWLGIPKKSLQFLLNQCRSPLYWEETKPARYRFRGWSTLHDTHGDKESSHGLFEVNDTLISNRERKYIVIGKGYP
jgi:hypothetical protein